MFEDIYPSSNKPMGVPVPDKSGPSGTSKPKTTRTRKPNLMGGSNVPPPPPQGAGSSIPTPKPTPTPGGIRVSPTILKLSGAEKTIFCYLMKYKKMYEQACPAGPGMGPSDDDLLNDVLSEMGVIAIDAQDRQDILNTFNNI